MKITKGYTLNQFVDLCNNDTILSPYELYNNIVEYNKFLKQPLKKEMFVNEVEKPNNNYPRTIMGGFNYEQNIEKWGEAENKVIFKGWKKSMYHRYIVVKGMVELDFSNADYPGFKCGFNGVVKTIGDLFQATNGQLELKNVQL